jgi:lipopolysaccharide heptosyltransferase I
MTGYGAEEHRRIEEVPRQRPDYTAVHLSDAVDRILSEQGRGKAEGAGHRILLIKPSSLGDIIHGLPVLRALREKWPSARISWVVKEQWADILRGHPMIDELILLRPDSLTRGLRAFRKRLRQGEYDLAVDLQGLFRSGLIAGLSGAKTRLGFGNAREGAPLFYTHRVTVAKELHAVDRNLALAASLLGRNSNPRVDHFTPNLFPLYVGPETYRRMIQRLTDILPPRGGSGAGMGSPRIALFPGGRWDKKRWPADGFTRLGLHLNRELNARIILLGSGQEGRLIQSVGDGLKDAAALTDLNLREMAALLSEMDLVITNDSGPMHIASAVGTPVVALFGPTDPGRTGPYGSMNRVVRFEMPCSPCFRRPCIHPRFLCMESITVEEVMDGAKKMLQGR